MGKFTHTICHRKVLLLVCCTIGLQQLSFAKDYIGVEDINRAKINYMLNCQGCHGADASEQLDGTVPALKDFAGNFLAVPGGREFLVQVPGSANAAIDDAQLTELLNWLLQRVSSTELPTPFIPYTTNEVSALRNQPEDDVIGTRAALIHAMAELK